MEPLLTERLRIRTLRDEDAEPIERYASDFDVAKTTTNIPHPYPTGGGKQFVAQMKEKFEEGSILTFAIENQDTMELIGLISLRVSEQFQHAEIGYWIGKPFWNKGYGTEAVGALLDFGFNVLNLHKIFARAFSTNPGSWRIMEKNGLTHEGTFKEHVYRWDEFHDLVFYGILKKDYINRTRD